MTMQNAVLVGPQMSPLMAWLMHIEMNDTNYDVRNTMVMWAVAEALKEGLAAGVRFDPSEPEWPVVYIELPTGQVSWHLPQHPIAWDGHTSEEKYARIRRYLDTTTPPASPT